MHRSCVTCSVVNNNWCDNQQIKFVREWLRMWRSERASDLHVHTFSLFGYLIYFHSVNIQYVRIDAVSLLVRLVVRIISILE